MKIKRFEAPDMRAALRQVQHELGAEAVILSTQNLGDQVCVIAALDYDAALLAPASEPPPRVKSAPPKPGPADAGATPYRLAMASQVPAQEQDETPATSGSAEDTRVASIEHELSRLRELLVDRLPQQATSNGSRPTYNVLHRVGFEPGLVTRLQTELQMLGVEENEKSLCASVVRRLQRRISDQEPNHIALVGPTGAGKTTTAAKIAARHLMRFPQARLRLVCTDTYRIGGREQLQSFARLLGAQVEVIDDFERLRAVVAETQAPDLLIIDTPGIGPRDHELARQLPLLTQIPGLCTLLCLQASTHPLESRRIVSRYASAEPAGLILTKLDETHLWGPSLSLVVEQDLPVFWMTDGQRVPQDLHRWNAATVIGHAVAAATPDDNAGQDTEVHNACA